MQGFGKKYRKPSGARMMAWPCLYEKNTNYLCLWLWGLGCGMTSPFEVCLCGEIMAFLFGLCRKMLSLQMR